MNKSESIKELATALAQFQGEVQDPAKNSDNPFFKSKYVELDGLLKATRPVTAKFGLSVIQWPSSQGLHTLITHKSGEWIELDPLPLNPTKNDPQGVGSAITYARRYSLSAALGVAWDDDDDGNGASGKQQNTPVTSCEPLGVTKSSWTRKSTCQGCSGPITKPEYEFSTKNPKYGKALCQTCQRKTA